jgi:hypothetical protein
MKYVFLFLVVALASCDPKPDNFGGYMGWAPIYATQNASTDLSITAAVPTQNPGKIYAYGNYLFQVDQNKGIHIIDNANPQQAHKISFLNVPGCSELAIKSNQLYTNNLGDLVVFDLSNIASPQLVSRLAHAFPLLNQTYPPGTGYFECVDPSKGVVVGWEEKLLTEPQCRR